MDGALSQHIRSYKLHGLNAQTEIVPLVTAYFPTLLLLAQYDIPPHSYLLR